MRAARRLEAARLRLRKIPRRPPYSEPSCNAITIAHEAAAAEAAAGIQWQCTRPVLLSMWQHWPGGELFRHPPPCDHATDGAAMARTASAMMIRIM